MKPKTGCTGILLYQKSTVLLSQILLLFLFVLPFVTKAQFYKPTEKTIRLGETLPEAFYQTIHQAVYAKTGQPATLRLADYRNKLIILDFWATWCKPCIYSLTKLDSIQSGMNSPGFVVIPVTYQRYSEVSEALKRHQWNMRSVIADTVLAQIFPHSGIPHQVWIKDGKVLTIPQPMLVTAGQIQNAVKGDPVNIPLNIQDRVLDPSRPLFVNGNGETGLYFKRPDAVIVRYLPDYRAEPLTYLRKADTTILYCCNLFITHLFYQAFQKEIFPNFNYTDGIVWEVSDETLNKFVRLPTSSLGKDPVSDSLRRVWISRNSYGYSLRYPHPVDERGARRLMQQDLNEFFGIYLNLKASVEPGPLQKYLVLRLKGSRQQTEKLLKSKSSKPGFETRRGRYYYKKSLFGEQLLSGLSAADLISGLSVRQVVDSTGIDPAFKIDFDFPAEIKGNLSLALQELSRYGLYLTAEEKRVPVLYIRERRK